MAGDAKLNEASLGRVAASGMRDALREFAEQVVEQFDRNLVSLALYGSVLEPGFGEHGAATSVMVVERVDLKDLRRLGEQGARLGRRGIAAPLAVTPEFIAASQDSFPLELMEIQQNHATLVGRDCFGELDLKAEHVRLQCEREFRRIAMRMRQGLLASGGREKLLSDLETDVGAHLVRTLRGILWLHGAKTYLPADEVMKRCEESTRRPLAGLRQAMSPNAVRGWDSFVELYDDVGALVAMANGE